MQFAYDFIWSLIINQQQWVTHYFSVPIISHVRQILLYLHKHCIGAYDQMKSAQHVNDAVVVLREILFLCEKRESHNIFNPKKPTLQMSEFIFYFILFFFPLPAHNHTFRLPITVINYKL